MLEDDILKPKPSAKKRSGIIFILLALLLIGVWVAWNLYRPQLLISRCTDVAEKSQESINRRYLEGDQNRKGYNQLFEECLESFGYYDGKSPDS